MGLGALSKNPQPERFKNQIFKSYSIISTLHRVVRWPADNPGSVVRGEFRGNSLHGAEVEKARETRGL